MVAIIAGSGVPLQPTDVGVNITGFVVDSFSAADVIIAISNTMHMLAIQCHQNAAILCNGCKTFRYIRKHYRCLCRDGGGCLHAVIQTEIRATPEQ